MRNRVDLSTVSSLSSISERLKVRSRLTISLKMSSLMAVGRIPASLSISSSLHISILICGKVTLFVSNFQIVACSDRPYISVSYELKELLVLKPGPEYILVRAVESAGGDESVLLPETLQESGCVKELLVASILHFRFHIVHY